MFPGHSQEILGAQILINIIIRTHPVGSMAIRALLPGVARFWSIIVTSVSKTLLYGSE